MPSVMFATKQVLGSEEGEGGETARGVMVVMGEMGMMSRGSSVPVDIVISN